MRPLLALAAVTFVAAIWKRNLLRRCLKRGSASKPEDAVLASSPEWQWPSFDQFEDEYGNIELKKRVDTVEDADKGPFRVIYRRKANQLWPDVVQIVLTSAPLIKIIQKYLPNNGDLQSMPEPAIDGRELFVVIESLKSHKISDGHAAGDESEVATDVREGELHRKHLVRFMDKEYADISVRVRRMFEENRVSWDLLWTFLPRDKKIVYNCEQSDEPLCGVVSGNYYFYNQFCPPGWLFLLELDVYDYDGQRYRKCQIRRRISRFEGERSFASVAVRPLEIVGEPDILEDGFLANGKRFYELAVRNKHRYMHYTGPLFQQRQTADSWQLFKENADGRVMIDLESFANMNPGYPMGNAQLPTSSKFWVSRSNCGDVQFDAPRESGPLLSLDTDSEVSNECLILAPAIVYGFSFTLKGWGSFAVNGFREISFNTNAFDELVMEPEVKGLVYNFVSQYIGTAVQGARDLQRVDPISNKGEGCVFLCYGPPGTGKTLTAESLAENMRQPLWSLSVSELGTTPTDLEKTLLKVLDIAANWKAVLLLDEADVYLEKRISSADLTRNAMTGVFLRLLEYYRGVLFLTTNRVGTFDDAFRSRISMFLRYHKLNIQQKGQVWKNLLDRAGVQEIRAEFLTELASADLNGREIRNAVHTAQIFARSHGEALEVRHVRYVMGVLSDSLDSLNDALLTSPHPYLATNGSVSGGY